jgi:signal transduction histidine kinase
MKQIEFPSEINLRQFLSAQSHDLKTPFNHVIGFSRIVLRGQDGPLTDFQKEDLNTVYNSGMRALGYMSALVEIARISNGERETSPADVDIRKAIGDAITQWKKGNPSRNFEIQNTFACTSPAFQFDEMQMRQVIVSLMHYVAEFVEGSAKMVVRAKEEQDWLVVTVQGVGNKTAAGSDLDKQMHGYIARCLVEQHQGVFRVTEETDEGAVITFAIPKKMSS